MVSSQAKFLLFDELLDRHGDSSSGVPVDRALQTEVFAKSGSLIFGAENAAPMQFWHHKLNKVVQAARQVRGHDVEAVAGVLGKPSLHVIGNFLGAAYDEAFPASTDGSVRELPYREIFTAGEADPIIKAA
jgi:hypothetical protein